MRYLGAKMLQAWKAIDQTTDLHGYMHAPCVLYAKALLAIG